MSFETIICINFLVTYSSWQYSTNFNAADAVAEHLSLEKESDDVFIIILNMEEKGVQIIIISLS